VRAAGASALLTEYVLHQGAATRSPERAAPAAARPWAFAVSTSASGEDDVATESAPNGSDTHAASAATRATTVAMSGPSRGSVSPPGDRYAVAATIEYKPRSHLAPSRVRTLVAVVVITRKS